MIQGEITLWRLQAAQDPAVSAEWSCTLMPHSGGLRMEIARDGSPWLHSSAASDKPLRKIAEAYRKRLLKSGWTTAS